VSSGFIVQTIASIINGIDIIPTICNNTNTCGFTSSGAVKNHGNGSETTNQITAKSIMVLARVFFLESNTLTQPMDDKLIWDFFILQIRRRLRPKQHQSPKMNHLRQNKGLILQHRLLCQFCQLGTQNSAFPLVLA
jgi:hypothetical protein